MGDAAQKGAQILTEAPGPPAFAQRTTRLARCAYAAGHGYNARLGPVAQLDRASPS
jgi:hypothetical protein